MPEEQKRRIKGVEVVRFENSGHGLFIDERDRRLKNSEIPMMKLARRLQCKSQLKCNMGFTR